jgi:hypothetical protein
MNSYRPTALNHDQKEVLFRQRSDVLVTPLFTCWSIARSEVSNNAVEHNSIRSNQHSKALPPSSLTLQELTVTLPYLRTTSYITPFDGY